MSQSLRLSSKCEERQCLSKRLLKKCFHSRELRQESLLHSPLKQKSPGNKFGPRLPNPCRYGKVRITSNNPFPVKTGHRLLATHSLEEILIVGNCMGTKTWERHCDVRFSPLFAAQPRSINREVTCWHVFLLHVNIFLPASTFLSSVWLKVYLLFLK